MFSVIFDLFHDDFIFLLSFILHSIDILKSNRFRRDKNKYSNEV